MSLLLNKNIKTILLLLLFIMIGTYLFADDSEVSKNENGDQLSPVNIIISNDYITSEPYFYSQKDTVIAVPADSVKSVIIPKEEFSIPVELAGIPINFQINSSISYLNFKHFVGKESKKLFFQAWLKEKELQDLSVLTDSLRKSYSNASPNQKEEISAQIMKAEKRTIVLNEEIPEMYQKAREKEDQFWQTASTDAITKFQEKITLYKDSLGQLAGNQTKEKTTQAEVPDTIILYKPSQKEAEKTAVVPSGIVYKIQIGAFKGKIPETNNKLIKKISLIRKVENYVDDKGVKIYTTGNLKQYADALTMLGQVKQEGIKTAVITAYLNGKKTTVPEARKLNNEL